MWLEAPATIAQPALAAAEALFRANEAALSRFLPSSELSQVNGRCGQWTAVSPLFWAVLTEALRLAADTNGLFDPTLLKALEQAGYNRSFELLEANPSAPDSGGWLAKPHLGRWSEVECDPERRAVRLPHGVGLDFGGIAKGYTAAQAVADLSAWGACLVSAGGDVTAGEPPDGWPGWPVALENAHDGGDVWTIWLANATLATSGQDYRRWQINGRSAHHLINPTTGQPAESDVLTATVWSPQATHAEAWAKTALILGCGQGAEAVESHGLAAAFVTTDNHITLTPLMHHLVQAFVSSEMIFAA